MYPFISHSFLTSSFLVIYNWNIVLVFNQARGIFFLRVQNISLQTEKSEWKNPILNRPSWYDDEIKKKEKNFYKERTENIQWKFSVKMSEHLYV